MQKYVYKIKQIFSKTKREYVWLENMGGAWQSDYGKLVNCTEIWFTIFKLKIWKLSEVNIPQTEDYIHYSEM